jgi:hypothetical protein
MRPESNKEQAEKFGNEFEERKGIIFVNISANLLKLFSFDHCLLVDPSV